MLQNRVVALALLFGSIFFAAADAQVPEVTLAARTAPELAQVLKSFGERGEMFGLTGPAAFLDSYSAHLDNTQPVVAELTFTTQSPMFAVELIAKDSAAFQTALKADGVEYDASTGLLAKTGSSLRFFAKVDGHRWRISDNAEFLNSVRWPGAETFNSQTSVVVRIDWRNLQPELRGQVAQQATSIFLRQTNPMAPLALDALPQLLSNATANRVAGLFARSESMVLKFAIQNPQSVLMTADVVNRALASRTASPAPFARLSSDQAIASCQWNTPIDNELRVMTQAWAGQLTLATKTMFAGDEIGDTSGLKVLQDGAAVLARHCLETIALPNLQGMVCVAIDNDRPVILAGMRVANPARLDGDLQKLLKAAIENGAPMTFTPHVGASDDLSIHRLELPIAEELAPLREMFGPSLTVHLATSSHALLVGIGHGSESLISQAVSAASGTSAYWLDASVKSSSPRMNAKLGLHPCQLSIAPATQGFQVTATLTSPVPATQLTSKLDEVSEAAK